MRKIAWLAACVILFGGLLFWFFWDLGDLPSVETPQATLQVFNGQVETKTGQHDWAAAKDHAVLQSNDSLRTGKDSSAIVTFFDHAQLRLTPSTEVVLSELAPGEGDASFKVAVNLVTGRAWSRVLRLFDLDDMYSVSAHDVVATVRGTAFDSAASEDNAVFSVLDSAVEIGKVDSAKVVVSQGFRVNFEKSGKLLKTELMGDDYLQSDWIAGNLRKDEAFTREQMQRREAAFQALGGQRPGSVMDSLARISENWHLAWAGERESQFTARYAARRLYQVLLLYKDGKSGAAAEELARLEDEISTQAGRGQDYRKALARTLMDLESVLREVGPSSPLYRMKQRIEDLQLRLAADALDAVTVRLRSIDARLDETDLLIQQASLDDAKDALEAAHQGIINIEIEIDRLPKESPADRVQAQRGKLNVLKAREAAMRIKLATALEPPEAKIGTPGSLDAATSTDAIASATTTEAFVSLVLSAVPSAPQVGQTVRLVATAETAQGIKKDVTTLTKFALKSGSARLNGPLLYPAVVGSLEITGDLIQNNQTLSNLMVLSISPKSTTLSRIRIVPSGATTLGFGQDLVLRVLADYSDGTSRDVTAQATFSSSNLLLGYFTANTFHANSNSGVARVGVSYLENGKVMVANLDLTIQPRVL